MKYDPMMLDEYGTFEPMRTAKVRKVRTVKVEGSSKAKRRTLIDRRNARQTKERMKVNG